MGPNKRIYDHKEESDFDEQIGRHFICVNTDVLTYQAGIPRDTRWAHLAKRQVLDYLPTARPTCVVHISRDIVSTMSRVRLYLRRKGTLRVFSGIGPCVAAPQVLQSTTKPQRNGGPIDPFLGHINGHRVSHMRAQLGTT